MKKKSLFELKETLGDNFKTRRKLVLIRIWFFSGIINVNLRNNGQILLFVLYVLICYVTLEIVFVVSPTVQCKNNCIFYVSIWKFIGCVWNLSLAPMLPCGLNDQCMYWSWASTIVRSSFNMVVKLTWSSTLACSSFILVFKELSSVTETLTDAIEFTGIIVAESKGVFILRPLAW